MRSQTKEYLGVLEATQDLTQKHAPEGERRLLSYEKQLKRRIAMERPTDRLMAEHDVIERYLVVLDAALERLKTDKPVPEEIFSGIADFFQTFVDRCHHAKEEEYLFPLFKERGMPSQEGPIGQMLVEHKEGRKLAKAFGAAAERFGARDTNAAPELIRAGKAYAGLLKDHIYKDNYILYPMGARLLRAEDNLKLLEAFEKIEDERIGEGVHHLKGPKLPFYDLGRDEGGRVGIPLAVEFRMQRAKAWVFHFAGHDGLVAQHGNAVDLAFESFLFYRLFHLGERMDGDDGGELSTAYDVLARRVDVHAMRRFGRGQEVHHARAVLWIEDFYA